MMVILLIVVVVAGIVVATLVFGDDSNFMKRLPTSIVKKAVIATKVSGNDFDVKLIALDILRLKKIGESLEGSDVTQREAVFKQFDELDNQLDEKLKSLGIYEEVEGLLKSILDKEMEEARRDTEKAE